MRCKISESDGNQVVLLRQRVSSGSYMCAHDPRLHFGLGTAKRVDELVVRWPDGSEKTLRDVKVDQVLKIKQ